MVKGERHTLQMLILLYPFFLSKAPFQPALCMLSPPWGLGAHRCCSWLMSMGSSFWWLAVLCSSPFSMWGESSPRTGSWFFLQDAGHDALWALWHTWVRGSPCDRLEAASEASPQIHSPHLHRSQQGDWRPVQAARVQAPPFVQSDNTWAPEPLHLFLILI